MYSNKEIILIKDWWPLERIKSVKKFEKGAINETYKIATNKNVYVLRLYNRESLNEIDFEVKLLSALKGLPTPELQKFNGKFSDYCLERPAVIYKYIEGEHLKSFTSEQLIQIGEFLGEFHNQTKEFKYDGERTEYYGFDEDKIQLYLDIINKSDVPFQERLNDIVKIVRENNPADDYVKGPIHIDVKPENVLFEDNKLSGVIDFDNAYIGPLILDLAKTMIWFGIKNDRFDIDASNIILEGYNKKNYISGNEIKRIPEIMKFAFASHLLVDYYMMARKKIPVKYFEYLMKDFYKAYQLFILNEEDVKKFIYNKKSKKI